MRLEELRSFALQRDHPPRNELGDFGLGMTACNRVFVNACYPEFGEKYEEGISEYVRDASPRLHVSASNSMNKSEHVGGIEALFYYRCTAAVPI